MQISGLKKFGVPAILRDRIIILICVLTHDVNMHYYMDTAKNISEHIGNTILVSRILLVTEETWRSGAQKSFKVDTINYCISVSYF